MREREATGFTEIHMVNGENPHVDFDFYVDTIAQLHEALPDVHLKCYTASEIHHMTTLVAASRTSRCCASCRPPGLGSLPGGGAEIFADRVRRLVAPGKEHPDIWFHVHDTAHRLGHPDALHDALRPRRDLRGARRPPAAPARPAGRDRRLPRLHPARVPSGEHRLRAARLQVPDRRRGPEDARRLAPAARQHPEHQGVLDLADDADRAGRAALRRERRPGHASCARRSSAPPARRPGTEQKLDELVRVVRDAGRIPVQRDTLYNELRRWDA